jgi:uncharacterized protein (DUF433 family)
MIAVEPVFHIRTDAREQAWIDQTNVKVIEVIKDWLAHDSSPEEMALQYPHLSLAQIHAALSHYYDHQADYDQTVASELESWDARVAENRNSPIRRKLRALGKLA